MKYFIIFKIVSGDKFILLPPELYSFKTFSNKVAKFKLVTFFNCGNIIIS